MRIIPRDIFRARSILESGHIISGLANCHLPGLYSFVLRERINENIGMLRIFYASETCKMSDLFTDGDYTLMPHNHRQAITLYGLFGTATNMRPTYSQSTFPMSLHEYQFGSALTSGKFSLEYYRSVSFEVSEPTEIHSYGIQLAASNIHTVIAEPGSAWLVSEGALSKESITLCYSLSKNKKLCSEGLYVPMAHNALPSQAAHLLGLWSEQ